MPKSKTTCKLPNFEVPTFDGTDFESFLKRLTRFFRLTNLTSSSDQIKKGLDSDNVQQKEADSVREPL